MQTNNAGDQVKPGEFRVGDTVLVERLNNYEV